MSAGLKDYRTSRRLLHAAIEDLVGLSASLNGTPSRHGRDYWSSLLLTKLTLTSMTLDKIVPKTEGKNNKELWDLTSIAALVRILAENYLLLFWLCTKTRDRALWDYRITLLTIADNRSRYRLTAEVEGEPEPDDFLAAQRNLGEQLAQMPLFQVLAPKRQRELLRGDKMPFIQDDVINSLEIDSLSFRRFYRYLSSFVHTGTISFFRMEAQGRGQGESNDYEANAILVAMEFARMVLHAAKLDIEKIHSSE